MRFRCPVLCGLGGLAASGALAAAPVDVSAALSKLRGAAPALAAAAVHKGQIVSAGVTGMRKHGDPTPVTLDDRFHLGSCTKSMTATLAAIGVEEEAIGWGTTGPEVFPELKIHRSFRAATLEQWLTNRGGAAADIEPRLWAALWEARGSGRDQRRQLLRGVLSEPAAYPPGSDQVYSNAGFSIAGAMLEQRAGRPFEVLMEEKLFEPLGMVSAGFGAPASRGKVDQPYGHVFSDGAPKPIDPLPAGDNPPAISPAGRVHGTVTDFARYVRFHLAGDGKPLLSRASMERLHRAPEGRDYAMGWVVTERDWAGGRVLTHHGTNTMFYAVMWLAPEKDFAAVAACNLGGDEGAKACDRAVAHLVERHLDP